VAQLNQAQRAGKYRRMDKSRLWSLKNYGTAKEKEWARAEIARRSGPAQASGTNKATAQAKPQKSKARTASGSGSGVRVKATDAKAALVDAPDTSTGTGKKKDWWGAAFLKRVSATKKPKPKKPEKTARQKAWTPRAIGEFKYDL